MTIELLTTVVLAAGEYVQPGAIYYYTSDGAAAAPRAAAPDGKVPLKMQSFAPAFGLPAQQPMDGPQSFVSQFGAVSGQPGRPMAALAADRDRTPASVSIGGAVSPTGAALSVSPMFPTALGADSGRKAAVVPPATAMYSQTHLTARTQQPAAAQQYFLATAVAPGPPAISPALVAQRERERESVRERHSGRDRVVGSGIIVDAISDKGPGYRYQPRTVATTRAPYAASPVADQSICSC